MKALGPDPQPPPPPTQPSAVQIQRNQGRTPSPREQQNKGKDGPGPQSDCMTLSLPTEQACPVVCCEQEQLDTLINTPGGSPHPLRLGQS